MVKAKTFVNEKFSYGQRKLYSILVEKYQSNFIFEFSRILKSNPLLTEEIVNMLMPIYVEQTQMKHISEQNLDFVRQLTGGAIAYGQEGEDLVLARLFPDEFKGYYVDVGAHHPTRFSNTYALYRKGWRGINIDATPGSMEPFKRMRPNDINLECAVSSNGSTLDFHVFVEPALNTFDAGLAEKYIQAGWVQTEIVKVQPRSLEAIFNEFIAEGQRIDLMNIDVEGCEMPVLQSNNWGKYSPQWIVIEVLDIPIEELFRHPCIELLQKLGYRIVSKLVQSVIMRREI